MKMRVFSKIIFFYFLIKIITCLDKEKNCKCRILPETKIVGGKQAHHLAYPWMASISLDEDKIPKTFKHLINEEAKINLHACGGSIINEHWVLTAAHCIPKNNDEPLFVGFGNDNDLVKIFDYGRIESIQEIQHPFFKTDPIDNEIWNDIALIKLKDPINFSESVKPACFMNSHLETYPGFLEHVGWGSTEIIKISPIDTTDSKLSRYLKEIFLTDQSDSVDFCAYNQKAICARGMEENESSCKGDSGGPIHYTKNGKTYVVGLTSFGNKIYEKDNYRFYCFGTTAYTRISSYITWIKKYVGEDICDF